jgi:hypothetical protein
VSACFEPEFLKNSLFLSWRPVSLDCIRHHPVSRARTLFALVAFSRQNRGFLNRTSLCTWSPPANRRHFRPCLCGLKSRSRREAEIGSMIGWWVPSSSPTVSTTAGYFGESWDAKSVQSSLQDEVRAALRLHPAAWKRTQSPGHELCSPLSHSRAGIGAF